MTIYTEINNEPPTPLIYRILFNCLFVLMLNVPVNNFLVISGRSHRFLLITSTFLAVNVSLLKDTAATINFQYAWYLSMAILTTGPRLISGYKCI